MNWGKSQKCSLKIKGPYTRYAFGLVLADIRLKISILICFLMILLICTANGNRSQGRGVMDRLRGGGRPSTTVPLRGGGSRGGSSGSGRGRGGGFGRGPKIMEKVSAEDLDADLEKYHAESMQTN